MAGVGQQIDRINAQISALNGKIWEIDKHILDHPEESWDLVVCMDQRRDKLDQRVKSLKELVLTLRTFQNNEIDGFSEEQQMIVNQIENEFRGKYYPQLNRLNRMDCEKKTEFCNLYSQAKSLITKESAIDAFFGLHLQAK